MDFEELKMTYLENARHTTIYCKIIYALLIMLAGSLCCNGYLFYKFMQNAFETAPNVITQEMADSYYSYQTAVGE